MKNVLVRVGIAAVAAAMVATLAACGGLGGNDPAKSGGTEAQSSQSAGKPSGNGTAANPDGSQNANGGETNEGGSSAAPGSQAGNTDGNGGGNLPAKPELPALVPFEDAFFAEDGTVYVGMPDSFDFTYGLTPSEDATFYWLDIPGTVPVKLADYFAIYNGKLYFTEFIHPSDAAARKTSLFVANKDGSDKQVLLGDVAAATKPVIIDGVIYYLSYDFDEGQEIFSFETLNDAITQEGDAMKCSSVMRSYDLTTGATASYEVCRTIAASFIGATETELFVYSNQGVSSSDIIVLDPGFAELRTITVPGYPIGVDAAGHVVSREWVGTSLYRLYVSDHDGNLLKTFDAADWSTDFSSSRYLMYNDRQGATIVFDTFTMAEVKHVKPLDNWANSMRYYYYNPVTDTVYFLGYHKTVPGIYTAYGSGDDLSVFLIDADGQTKRVLPYLDVLWCRTGEWDSPQGYVLQWCEIDFYSYEQLSQLSNEQLFHARNEDFWCHGYDFNKEMNDPELQAYYEKKTWPRELSNSRFTAAELWNFAIIEQIEAERDSPYAGRGYTLEYLDSLN